MQCSVILERDCNSGNVKMKTLNSFKNPYTKETSLNNIVDQLCTRLQDIKDQESASLIGMPTCSLEQNEAVRRYYAAFPALKKAQESPLQYYLPPPAWCRKNDTKVKMQSDLIISKDWNCKNKKVTLGKERRNSYHGQKKNSRKRFNSYSRSFESKESMPEWMTHEGVWDIETQDPVKEFIRAIALDEGYGTCENTVTDEIKEITQAKLRLNENMVPDWDDSLDLDTEWVITDDLNPPAKSPMDEEIYAKFEAKFDHSLEALWSKDQNTPDDEYQDLPIDFQDLLSSPSDHLFADPSAEKNSLITESIWSTSIAVTQPKIESPSKIAEGLHDRLRPLNIRDPECPRELESFTLYEGEELYDALSSVAKTMRSFTAINHSRDRSGFVEVPPRLRRDRISAAPLRPPPFRSIPPPEVDREDPLTSSRTHFRPIRREPETEATRYADGDTFDIRGDYDPVEFKRSESGSVYLENTHERYLEYRATNTIDYGRLNLGASQRRRETNDLGFKLRFPMRQIDTAVQTERSSDAWACDECGGSAKKMRPSGIESIWSDACVCECAVEPVPSSVPVPPEELSRDWEELLSDISAAHRMYANDAETDLGVIGDDSFVSTDRKRRHSAALRCGAPPSGLCTHPHARFLHCCVPAVDRPLTR